MNETARNVAGGVESEGAADPGAGGYRVEARNERADEGAPSTFDFVIEGDDDRPAADASLSLLAGVLGTAGCGYAAADGLDLAVERVVVETGAQPTRSDGGDVPRDEGAFEVSTRVVVELDSREPPQALTHWRERLLDDARSLSTVPAVDSLLVVVRNGERPSGTNRERALG